MATGSGYAYPARVVAIDPGGPIVVVPLLALNARWGPVQSGVADLEVGDQVIVMSLGISRDQLAIIARLPGRSTAVGEVPGLAEALADLDSRIDAVDAEQNADAAAIGSHTITLGIVATQQTNQDNRLSNIEVLNTGQNTRLSATEGVANTAASTNTTQNTRLDATEGVANTATSVNNTQNTRLTATEGVANTAASTNTTQDGRLTTVEAYGSRLTATEGVANGAVTVNNTQNSTLGTIATQQTTQDGRLTATEGVANAAATAATVTALTTATTGRVTTKGDLLVATGSGVLARQAVGANGLTLVADSAQTNGVAYAERRGVPLSPTGATAASRYLGALSGVGPPAAPLVGAVGDFVLDTNQDIWACSVAGTPGTWVSRTALSRVSGQHAWTGSGSPNHNAEALVTSWTSVGSVDAIATYAAGTGQFLLNRAGRWSFTYQHFSDLAVSRVTQARVNWPSGAQRLGDDMLQTDHPQGGYAGSGFSWVRLSWSGWVTATQATSPLAFYIYQSNASSAALLHSYAVHFSFMGS